MSSHKSSGDKRSMINYPVRQCRSMAELRQEIDQLDRTLVELLSVRQGFMEQAAHIKKDRSQVRDAARIEDVVTKVLAHADKVGAYPELVEKLYRDMIEWCISHEMATFDGLKSSDD